MGHIISDAFIVYKIVSLFQRDKKKKKKKKNQSIKGIKGQKNKIG
jgi:hypothetical protein